MTMLHSAAPHLVWLILPVKDSAAEKLIVEIRISSESRGGHRRQAKEMKMNKPM